MITVSLKIPESLARRLKETARRRRMTQSAVIRKAIEDSLVRRRASVLDLIGDLAGSIEGPPDLSTNPKYMAGYGK